MRRVLRTVLSGGVVAVLAAAGLVLPATVGNAATAPAGASGLTVTHVSERAVSVAWTNSADPTLDHVVLLFKAGTARPASATDGTQVPLATATATSATFSVPSYKTSYSVDVFSCDNTAPANCSPSQSAVVTHAYGAVTVSAVVSPSVQTYGSSTRVSGRLLRTADNGPAAGEQVRLYARPHTGGTSRLAAFTTTAADGSFVMTRPYGSNTDFQVVHLSSPYFSHAETPIHVAYVRPQLSFSAPLITSAQQAFRVGGVLRPALPGVSLVLQQYYGGAWHSVALMPVSSTGSYGRTLQWRTPVVTAYRAVFQPRSNYAGATTAFRRVTVVTRSLSSGMRGSDVVALQRQLAAMHYDLGAITGVFDYDTLHAVIAFQKVNGLARDGVVGPAVRGRLAHPVAPALRSPRSGRAVEVNKTLQVVLLQVDGHIVRIVDASTGGNYFYYQNGVRYQAVTPEGHFAVQWKINGWHTSQLGQMYRPSYFYQGYAIHGEDSVPAYPASHGCVRIINSAADRYYAWLVVGTPVYVYH